MDKSSSVDRYYRVLINGNQYYFNPNHQQNYKKMKKGNKFYVVLELLKKQVRKGLEDENKINGNGF